MNFDSLQLIYILRILFAGICGAFVGLERKNRSKEAGMRTHFIVASASALMMIISKYAFFDLIEDAAYIGADVRLDPSRVASTIASGIGFLGAGMIFVHKNTITGLTTAAGIWATAGVGMAIGAGMYTVGIVATLLLIIAQVLLHMKIFQRRSAGIRKLTVRDVDEISYQQKLTQMLENMNVVVSEISVEKDINKGSKKYTAIIDIAKNCNEDDIADKIQYSCSISML